MIWEELSYNKYNCPFESQEDDKQYNLKNIKIEESEDEEWD